MQSKGKVAVVAIHGVGDPKPGDTASGLARLLVAREGFRHEGHEEWLVRVQPVPAGEAASHPDQAIRFQDKLLKQTQLPERDEIYVAHRHALDGPEKVDVIELHWGDLSGLTGAATRILSEMYTLGLRFSQLGRDAVRHHIASLGARPSPALQWLARFQHGSACMLTQPIVLLNVLLLMVSLWWMLCVALLGTPPDFGTVHTLLGVVALGVLLVCLSYGAGARRLLLASAATTLFAMFAAWGRAEAQVWVQSIAALALGAAFLVLYFRFLRFYDTLVRGSRVFGTALLVVTLLVVPIAWDRRMGYPKSIPDDSATVFPSATWAFITANVLEVVMLMLAFAWAVMGLTVGLTAILGWRVRRRAGPRSETMRAIDTGRFGLFCSVSLFLLLTVGGWVALQGPLGSAFGSHTYYPAVGHAGQPQPIASVATVHFAETLRGLSLVLVELAVLVFLAVSLLMPSVMAEVRPPKPGTDGTEMGEWLTRTGRRYALIVSGVAFWGAMLMAVIVLLRLLSQMAWMDTVLFEGAPPWLRTGFAEANGFLADITNRFADFVKDGNASISAAGAGSMLGIISVASRLFGTFSKVRVPVDIALDVDNHFREFPVRGTPRGRIAARMYSVLEAIREAGYDRIVIVAHSQGTVITADLLRYLRATQPGWWKAMPEIRLFTCGSPLRQLYASRFPALYRWTEDRLKGQVTGPSARALGVRRWTNAYCTGDYVGRWLWQDQAARPLHSMRPPGRQLHRQVCLGAGAHTHYYDLQMAQVAREVHALIR